MKETEKIVGLFDIHTPYEDKKALSAVIQYLADTQVDHLVLGGDLLDFDFISSFSVGKLRKLSGKSFTKQYKAGNEILDMLDEAVGGKCKKYFLEGNHDERVQRYIDLHPETEGELEVPTQLNLSERGWEWIPCWSTGKTLKLGKAMFHHGLYTREHHAKMMVSRFGKNIFYGHIHDIQSHSLELYGDNSTQVGQSCGCLCRYDVPGHEKGQPSKWQQGFLVMDMLPNGFFNYSVTRIFNGKFVSPRGEVYEV